MEEFVADIKRFRSDLVSNAIPVKLLTGKLTEKAKNTKNEKQDQELTTKRGEGNNEIMRLNSATKRNSQVQIPSLNPVRVDTGDQD